eukprot:13796184-Ditylum_brightwellii.AAC.1
MLIHAMLHWPEQVVIDLWPFAFDYAICLYNHLHKWGHQLAHIKLFTNTKLPHSWLKYAIVWGCPSYALKP